jgi:hypothetical protein
MNRRTFIASMVGTGIIGTAAALSLTKGARAFADAAADPLISALDLTQPALAKVKAAVDRSDNAGARAAFADHLRTRATPLWSFDPATPPKDATPRDMSTANNTLKHLLTSVGIPYQFGDRIDWSYNPTTQPGSPNAVDYEWTWQLSRHEMWVALAKAYNTSGDSRYGVELAAEIAQWITDDPVPAKVDNAPGSRWRTIECGIRMGGAWPEIYYRMLRSKEIFTDDVLLAMVECMHRHAEYLLSYPTSGNWLFMESNGLFHVGVISPEFARASMWRDTGMARLHHELDLQIYPDGVQFELTPNYHNVTIDNSVWAFGLAQINNVVLPAGALATLERMYAVDMLAMGPDHNMPPFNDSGAYASPGKLHDALRFFPNRADFQYIATRGASGTVPSETSHIFPWAGWALMRTGWDEKARFMMFDGGPFGYGHQHEDKLSFVLHGYGRQLIYEGGTYPYDASAMRQYVLDARAHNVVNVDGILQHRRGQDNGPLGRMIYVTKKPVNLTWKSSPDYDYASASYGAEDLEGWGPKRLKNVVHTRRILFVKPDYWVIVDSLEPTDTVEHLYESMFHVDASDVTLDTTFKSAISNEPNAANIAIVPLVSDNLDVRSIKGQMQPFVQGWLPQGYAAKPANARPAVYFSKSKAGSTHFLYVFLPIEPGAQAVLPTVTAVANAANAEIAADIAFAGGKTHRVVLSSAGSLTFSSPDRPPFSIG